MTKLADLARVARNEAIAKLLRGGHVEVYAGEPPATCDEPVGERPCLVKVSIPDSPLQVRADRQGVLARGIEKAQVDGEGEPSFWRAVTRTGQVVMQGEVHTGDDARAAIAKGEALHGLAMDVSKLWRGMEFDMPEFRFNVGGAQ